MSAKKFAFLCAALLLISLADGFFFSAAVPGKFFVSGTTFFFHAAVCAAALAAMVLFPVSAPDKTAALVRKIKSLDSRLLAAGIFVLFFAVLVAVNRFILVRFMNSGDEHSCFFMANCFLRGRLWATPHPLKEFFTVTHIGEMGAKWFSVYPPGWPLVWAGGIALGLKDLTNPLLTAAAAVLWLRAGEKIYGKSAALAALPLLLISPFFIFTGASYYSHPLCLFLLGSFFFVMLKWHETRKPVWGLYAGLLLGFGLAVRYLTMAAMAFPVVVLTGLALLGDSKSRKGILFFALGAGVLIGAHAGYNKIITGSFLDAPNHFLHSHEKLGFISGYTPLTGLQYLGQRILYAMDWTPPFVVLLFLVSICLRPGSRWKLVCRISAVLLPAAYFLYYSWGGNQYGPRYLYELYPIACFEAGALLLALWQKSDSAARKGILGFFLTVVCLGAVVFWRQGAYFQKVSSQRRASYAAAESQVKKPALVFIKGFLGDLLVMAPDDTVRNFPFLDSEIVYAHDLGPRNRELEAFFPERSVYLLSYDRANLQPVLERGKTASSEGNLPYNEPHAQLS